MRSAIIVLVCFVLVTAATAPVASAGGTAATALGPGSFESQYDFFTNFGNYLPHARSILRADGTPDGVWIGVLLVLNAAIFIGYLKIFRFWRQCYLAERADDRHNKLMDLARIFLLCAMCGYGFFIITMFWPAYRLMAVFLLALSVVTWRFAFDLDSFRLSFSAKRLQRELNEHLQRRNDELAGLVDRRTRELERATGFKRQFLSNMSHELRTPMTAILGFSDLLSDPALDAGEHDNAVKTIQRNGRHLLGLLNDVLDLSKIEAGKFNVRLVACDVNEVVCEVVTLLAHQAAEQGVTLAAKNRTPVPHAVLTDPMRLRQILTNLVGNSLKFTTRGDIEIAISYRPGQAAGRGILEFAVTDTGCGIAPEALERIFQPFEQANAAALGGTGLGLTISRSLAGLLGGDIAGVSTPNEGSTFTLTIEADVVEMRPPSQSRPDAVPVATQGVGPVCQDGKPLQGRHVLVAEDAPDAQLLLRFLLRNWGADAVIVNNGADAFDQVTRAGGRPFDVMLTDMQMPIMDGISVTKKLREHGVDVPIIMLTANAMAGDRERCIEAGCTDYVAKPVEPALLLEKIAAVLDRRSSLPAPTV